jgi:hypothetical protein
VLLSPVSPTDVHVTYRKQYLVSVSVEGLPANFFPPVELDLGNNTVIADHIPCERWFNENTQIKFQLQSIVWPVPLVIAYQLVSPIPAVLVDRPLRLSVTYSRVDIVWILELVIVVLAIDDFRERRKRTQQLTKVPKKEIGHDSADS